MADDIATLETRAGPDLKRRVLEWCHQMIAEIRATDAFRQAMDVPVSKLPALSEWSSPGPGVYEVHDQYVGESYDLCERKQQPLTGEIYSKFMRAYARREAREAAEWCCWR
jgi:hypothetical protein